MLEQVEQKRSKLGEQATIVMKYRVNGKEEQEWRWPPHLHRLRRRTLVESTEIRRHRFADRLLILVKSLALVLLLEPRQDPARPLATVRARDRPLPPVLFQRTLQTRLSYRRWPCWSIAMSAWRRWFWDPRCC